MFEWLQTFKAEPGTVRGLTSMKHYTPCGPSVCVYVCVFPCRKHWAPVAERESFHLTTFLILTDDACHAWQLHHVSGGSYHLHVPVLLISWVSAEFSLKTTWVFKTLTSKQKPRMVDVLPCKWATSLSTLQPDVKSLYNTRKTHVCIIFYASILL